MEDGNSHYFDLVILLKLGDVNFLRVTRNNLSLRVGEYYDLLSRFEKDTQKGMDALVKISAQKADTNDINNAADIKELLKDIGCTKVVTAIDDIVKTVQKGSLDTAAAAAKQILAEYTSIQKRLMAAKKAGKPEIPSGVQNEEGETVPQDYETQLLKDALLRAEEYEASRKLRVLAVDDAPIMIKTISAALSDEYKVHGMTNPTMLEKFLGQITPDLFLLDYQMPEINGFELVPMIRNFEEHKDTPIIFLTSMGTMEHVSTAAALGACDFIVKPFQGDNLLEKVTKHIVRKKISF